MIYTKYTGLPFFLFAVVLLTTFPCFLQAQQLSVVEAKTEFHGRTTVERFTGITHLAEGGLNLETGAFSFKIGLNKLDTGNSRRDNNMHKDYLETDRYPYALFEGKLSDFDAENFRNPSSNEEIRVTATGSFTLKEITRDKQIEGSLMYDGTEGNWVVLSNFDILLTDFEISRPRFLFIRMDDSVNLDVRFVITE
ncbi:MAG: YceI family protein [Balneolales bacterium]|nr:YceI family protein [Balneolales bacterium]